MRDYVNQILSATTPADLFGEHTDEHDVHARWRRLSRLVHPDVNSDPLAEDAVKRLNELHDLALRQFATSSYGVGTWTATTRKGRRYEFQEKVRWVGDSCDLFLGDRLETGNRVPVWVKVARIPKDNDLLANEMKAIRRVLAGKSADEHRAELYVAPLSDSFQVAVKGARHRANVFEMMPGTITMKGLKGKFPGGVPAKHVAWMFRRLMWALALAHDAGVVHGAVLPQHILMTPEQHGVTLLDWRAASIDTAPIAVLSLDMREFYPARLLEQQKARPEYDIAMAAACMEWVAGGRENLPRPMRGFFKGCRAPSLPSTWELRNEFTGLIEGMWGPRVFRPFTVPQ